MKPVLTYPITDKQIAFDYVWHHFVTENNPRGVEPGRGVCVYDTPSGGCAVGCLLPPDLRSRIGQAGFAIDELLTERRCNSSIDQFLTDLLAVFPESADMIGFLTDLQKAHDHASAGDAISSRLAAVAYRFNLVVPQ